MIDLLRVCAGRAGVGAWRSRKQLVWGICVVAGLLIIYVQFSPSSQIPTGEIAESQHRSLHSISKHNGNPSNSPTSYGKRVSFISKSAKSSYTDPGGGTVKAAITEDNDIVNPLSGAEKLDKNLDEGKQNAVNEELQNNALQFQYPQVPAGSVASQQETFVVDNWNNGPYKYNSFGEPVYGHTNRPNYVPKHRIVHVDLKGAPIKVSVLKTLMPWLSQQGATGVLLEYEDMFPYEKRLESITAKNHYSISDIKEIVRACKINNLEVIPLVQTFGHLEFALKGEMFTYLREVPEIPLALCPSLNDSVWFIRTMIDQVMKLHQGVKYLHIGCDEVWQMGECERCRFKTRENIFLQHVSDVAKYVRSRHKVIPIIWHDMLSHVSDVAMKEYNFGSLVEPMVWVYAEDIYRFVPTSMWTKFSEVFDHIWSASAFKGAFGEQNTVPNVRRHLDNNLNWLDVMAAESSKFRNGFRGIVLTGWQRFDHFAVLCELFPVALPSLAVNLITNAHGFFNTSVQTQLYQSLNCMQTPKYQTALNLDSDPFLWDKFSWCFFPGALVFKVTARLDSAKKDVDAFIERVTQSRGWITEYNRRHNFSSPMRIDEDLEELPSKIHTVTLLLKTAKEALSEWFDDWTIGEWIELHIWPLLHRLETLQNESENMKLFKTWPRRPFPLLKAIEAYGIVEPRSDRPSEHHQNNPEPMSFNSLDKLQPVN